MSQALEWLRRLVWRMRRAVQFDRHARWRREPIRARSVLYEAFAGAGMLGNPEAIFRTLAQAHDFADLEHVWVVAGRGGVRRARRDYARGCAATAMRARRVRFVRYRSARYFKALATSQYLVNNAAFPPEFGKRPGQTYLNTWHGTPLKRMGYDVAGGAAASAHVLRNLVCADYLLAQNPFMSRTLYDDAYRMRGVFTGLVVEEGYPRVDRQRLTGEDFLCVRDRLERAGIDLAGRHIILFAPTWRGPAVTEPKNEIAHLERTVAELQRRVGADYVVLLTLHPSERRFAVGSRGLRRVLVPDDVPTNLLLGAASALVTDYSSIVFDFLTTGRPIVFYTPDMPDYSNERGFYQPPSTWPGPLCRTVAELAGSLCELLAPGAAPHPRYAAWQRDYAAWDDGAAADRVVDVVFRGRSEGYRLRRGDFRGRTRVLVSLGDAPEAGAAADAIQLVNALDPDRYDVSITYSAPRAARWEDLGGLLPPQVRHFPRVGGMNGSKIAHLGRRLGMWRAARSRGPLRLNRRLWHDEAVRCFGATPFDVAIDASGDDPFWAALMLHTGARRTLIWLAGDAAARQAAARGPAKRRLAAVASLCARYDLLISATPALTEANRAALAPSAPADRVRTIRALPDERRVIAGAQADILTLAGHPREPETGIVLPPAWAWRLHRPHRTQWFAAWPVRDEDADTVLRAFARVHEGHPDTACALIAQRQAPDTLERKIAELGLTDSAYAIGAAGNPYPILAAVDSIVLLGRWDARPAALLELALLRTPLVATGPSWLREVLPDGAVTVVPPDVAALADALTACLEGGVAPSTLNVTEYREAVQRQFDDAVGIRPAGERPPFPPPGPHQESRA